MYFKNSVTAGCFWRTCKNTQLDLLPKTMLFLSWMHLSEIVYTG